MGASDRVALVVYAGNSGLVLPSTPGNEQSTILDAIARLRAGGSVLMRAELDLVLVVSACPQDIIQINEGKPSPVEIELL